MSYPFKDHIIFSVGGALGSAQIGKWMAVRENYRPSAYYGSSVGALNAAMCATGQAEACYKLWLTISNKQVYNRRFSVFNAAVSALMGRSVLDLKPLKLLMHKYLFGKICQADLTVQYSTYQGQLITKTTKAGKVIDGPMIEAIYSSCAIPFVFPTDKKADGGLIKPIPLGAAIERAEPGDRMVIFSCHPVKPYVFPNEPDTQIDKLGRSLKIMQAALVRSSIDRFLEINQLMQESGMFTWEYNKRTYKRFTAEVYAPDVPLWWGMVDFDQSSVSEHLLNKQ